MKAFSPLTPSSWTLQAVAKRFFLAIIATIALVVQNLTAYSRSALINAAVKRYIDSAALLCEPGPIRTGYDFIRLAARFTHGSRLTDGTVNEYVSAVLFPGRSEPFTTSVTEVNMFLGLLNAAVLAGAAEAPVVGHALEYLPRDVVQYLPSSEMDRLLLTVDDIKAKLLKNRAWDCSARDQHNAMQAVHIAATTVGEVTLTMPTPKK